MLLKHYSNLMKIPLIFLPIDKIINHNNTNRLIMYLKLL